MSSVAPQSLESVSRYVPGFHFFAGGLTLVNLIWALVRFGMTPSAATGQFLLLALILPLLFWYVRAFPVGVQDRVICVEERLRLTRLLPDELHSRIPEFSPGQLIALRFASDAELPALAQRVLKEQVRSRRAIMALVQQWRADHRRI